MKAIKLTKGKIAVVDDSDHEWSLLFSWRAKSMQRVGRPPVWYAVTTVPGERKDTYLHREILRRSIGLSNHDEVDHKDGDGLNNQRSNLRPCTTAQNGWNRKKRSGGSSVFKGVSLCRSRNKWESKIMVHGKRIFLGRFESESAAARAYDLAARNFFGEFSKPNFA